MAEQIENGEQPLQSFVWSVWEDCPAYSSCSQLSKTEQGTTVLNKIYKSNTQVIPFLIRCKNS